jgi:hypothetical protein
LESNVGTGWLFLDSGVTSFAFGNLDSAGYLVVLTTSGMLQGNNGNGFQQWATGVALFVVDPQTGAIDYVTTDGKQHVYIP